MKPLLTDTTHTGSTNVIRKFVNTANMVTDDGCHCTLSPVIQCDRQCEGRGRGSGSGVGGLCDLGRDGEMGGGRDTMFAMSGQDRGKKQQIESC